MKILNIIFPAMMVAGAIGSMTVNVFSDGSNAITLQWIGASLLYTALLLRNI